MQDEPSQIPRHRSFGQLLTERRTEAGLSLPELASLTRLPLDLLAAWERDEQPAPSFDVCYKIAAAINSRRLHGFLVQDLWQAARNHAMPHRRSVSQGSAY